MVYGRYNELVNGVYKPTNITGGHHPAGTITFYQLGLSTECRRKCSEYRKGV